MKALPTKLERYLNTLPPDERNIRLDLYHGLLAIATEHGFQSARFWAMRQVVSGLSEKKIQQKIKARIDKAKDG